MSETHNKSVTSNSADATGYKALLQQSLLTLKEMRAQLEAAEREKNEPIAILGIGCRFPNGVKDPESFWRFLRVGGDAISEVPSSRWDVDAYYDPTPGIPGKMTTRWGGFLEQVDQFDAAFFGIAPREAKSMDPQQRLALEVAWEALEHACQPIDHLAGSKTGVFIGISSSDYSLLENSDPAFVDAYVASGTSNSVVAGRISYILDLRGPSVVLDTACSSSLVAVHQAAQSLRNRECDLAIAGGVNLILSPLSTLALSHWGMMAKDGRCKTFDRRADGFVRGEGCGMIVLKRLSQALAAGDPILAVIRGSAVNQDGRSAGLTAPNMQAQQAVIRQALTQAGIPAEQISYVEAHGTGTSLGDPIEFEALRTVLGRTRTQVAPATCWIGSVKTNLGHTEAAAGIAGLIKVVLALQHEQIPPHLHFETLNPNIVMEQTPFAIPTQLQAWPLDSGQPRYAGISSFGFSGTNAHIIITEAPPLPVSTAQENVAGPGFLLPLSARSPQALLDLANAYQQCLQQINGEDETLQNICYTASTHHIHHKERLAVTGKTTQELIETLAVFQLGELPIHSSELRFRPIFVFPGQGSQWVGMGQQLLQEEPVFRQALADCEEAMQPYIDWSLLQQVQADETTSRFTEIDVVQPVLFALQVALARLWSSWGILPQAVVGHSMGEVAAAHVAGMLSLPDAARIICRRSQLLRRIRGQGMMALVEADLQQAQELIADERTLISIAASNGPRTTVLSGDTQAIEQLLVRVKKQGIFCRAIQVDVASHSSQVDPLRQEVQAALQGLKPQAGQVPLFSTVQGRWLTGEELDANYWMSNLREPVQFWQAMQQLREEGYTAFVEISAHPVLVTAMQEGVEETVSVIGSLKRQQPERAALLQGLASLYQQGADVSWEEVYRVGGRCVPLPSYPWQREHFWLKTSAKLTEEAGLSKNVREYISSTSTTHTLLGRRLSAALQDTLFESQLSSDAPAFLGEHQVSGKTIFPGTAYIVMALAALSEMYAKTQYILMDTTFFAPLLLSAQKMQHVQIVLKPDQHNSTDGTWQIFALQTGTTDNQDTWQLHASGIWQQRARMQEQVSTAYLPYQEFQAQSLQEINGAEYYRQMQDMGFEYGPSFQGIRHLWLKQNEALGQLQLAKFSPIDILHPAALDACLQVFSATMLHEAAQNKKIFYLPSGIEQIRVYRPFPEHIWSHAVLHRTTEAIPETIKGDIRIYDAEGEILAEMNGFTARRANPTLSIEDTNKSLQKLLYQLQWHPQSNTAQLTPSGQVQKAAWLIFSDPGTLGQALASTLEQRGASCTLLDLHTEEEPVKGIEQQIKQALGDHREHYDGIIYLWSLAVRPTLEITNDSLLMDQHVACGGLLYLVKALMSLGNNAARHLWIMTRGAQAVEGVSIRSEDFIPAQASVWGLGRTIAFEYPELHSVLIDLDPAEHAGEVDDLCTELTTQGTEGQIAYRNRTRYVARLEHYRPQKQTLKEDLLACAGRPVSLEITERGTLDNLVLRASERRLPTAGEVEIQVEATGLNFRDILNVLAQYPDTSSNFALGSECAGKIVAVGPDVKHLQVGDRVSTALMPGCFKSFITLSTLHVAAIPDQLSFTEAASIPSAFLTVYYALHNLARIKAGERILIHSAAGGVGLAAVQIAQQVGADIYATAGNPEKRAYLKSLGVQYVMDSRTLDFADEIMQQTQGQGVDIVLNALTGAYITKSMHLLASGGRFIELGKAEIWDEKQLSQTRPDIIYTPLDIGEVFQKDPQIIQDLLQTIFALLQQSILKPLPCTIFPLEKADAAFRYMAQARHIGKIVITQPDTANIFPTRLREDGSYLITGAFGGLGLVIARWMADRGARHLALMGRSEPSPAAMERLRELSERGVQIHVIRADVSQHEEVSKALATLQQEMPPLRGVVHAAGVIHDGVLTQQKWTNFVSVMAPKVQGTWNLHQLTQEMPLDFFVLFSSMASLLGSAGQGNYAAANAFMDMLATYRRSRGLPAVSISWGAWSGVGLAAGDVIHTRIETRGLHAITPEKGCQMMDFILARDFVHVGVSPINWPNLAEMFQGSSIPGFLRSIIEEETQDQHGQDGQHLFSAQLAGVHASKRLALLTEHIRTSINRVMGLAPSHHINPQQGLFGIGMDSLMAVEVKNTLSMSIGHTLPATLLFDYPTIAALVEYLAYDVLLLPKAEAIDTYPASQEEEKKREQTLERLAQLSDDEVESMLLEKLAHMNEGKIR